jgi:8-oxo-dGTP pyrophosphatase MutT (NUDIX family)
MSFQDEIYQIADELRSIANSGLHYAENDYDRQRYEHALSLSARLVAGIEERSTDEIMQEYQGDLAHVTPYVSADAAVFRDGTILLIKRDDNGLWAMPGGATEVGETWA